MIMAASKMIHTSRKGGAVEHLAMSSDAPSLCGRMAYGTGNGKRLCKTCARIARVDMSAMVGDWTDAERVFIHMPREAGQWQMLADVVDDYARLGEGSNNARRIALYQAALSARSMTTTVITNHSDARMIQGNGNGFGTKSARVPGATENQRNALRKMAAFVDSLFSQLFELQGKEISESDPTTLGAMTDEWFNNLTRTEIDKQFKSLSALIERLKGECNKARDAKRTEERKAGKVNPAEDGYYVYGDTFVCVKWNRAKTGQYATVWDTESQSWEYDGSQSRKLMVDVKAGKLSKVTPEDAKRFGDLYGVCMKCSRTLTDPESIANGIGPVCAGKMGW